MSQQNPGNYSAFTTLMQRILGLIDPQLSQLYTDRISLVNYACVCGVGVLINMATISFLFDFGLGLLVSNSIAILCAFTWNWTFSVGPYGYLFDLTPKPEIKKLEA